MQPTEQGEARSPALELRQITKKFPGTLAVDRVDFDVMPGEVHAIMGENGAGKSTLMNVIAGTFSDYEGAVTVFGEEKTLHSPALAKAAGIGMIHQELSLALPLPVAENLFAGTLPTRFGIFMDGRRLQEDARRLLAQVGLERIHPRTPVEDLSQHEAQLVEIAKALGGNPAILVMDEPTSALSRAEVDRLFAIIEGLKQAGMAVIYISHHIPEIFRIADRVTVMQDGRKVLEEPIGRLTPETLVEAMVGRSLKEWRVERAAAVGGVRLVAENMTRRGFFHDVSLTICAGEILGLGGLAGAGRSEFARSLCGLDALDAGGITLDGKKIVPSTMRRAMKHGLGYIPEDRKRQGLALKMRARDNTVSALTAKSVRRPPASSARSLFARHAETLQLNPPQPARRANQFSGGNQQKILLAKWLATSPEVLILDEPTRGVDVGAKQVIHRAVAEYADSGRCVLLISSDLPEMADLCDRVVVLRKGKVVAEMAKADIREDTLLLAANGEWTPNNE